MNVQLSYHKVMNHKILMKVMHIMQLSKAQIIGKNIKKLRKQAQLTQVDLAQGIGTQAQISKIEQGLVIPLSTTLYEIAEKLGVDLHVFFEHVYEPQSNYLKEVKNQIRKEIRHRHYEEVERILTFEAKNNIFQSDYDYQFFLWHKGILTFYIDQKHEKSIAFLEEAFKLTNKNNDTVTTLQEVEILNSIAIIYNEIQDYRQSIAKYKQAIRHFKEMIEITDRRVEIRLYYGLAKSLFKNQYYEESIAYCKKGINVCINEEILYLLGELYYEQGQNYQALEKRVLAHNAYQTAKQLFQIGKRPAFIKVVDEKLTVLKEDASK